MAQSLVSENGESADVCSFMEIVAKNLLPNSLRLLTESVSYDLKLEVPFSHWFLASGGCQIIDGTCIPCHPLPAPAPIFKASKPERENLPLQASALEQCINIFTGWTHTQVREIVQGCGSLEIILEFNLLH